MFGTKWSRLWLGGTGRGAAPGLAEGCHVALWCLQDKGTGWLRVCRAGMTTRPTDTMCTGSALTCCCVHCVPQPAAVLLSGSADAGVVLHVLYCGHLSVVGTAGGRVVWVSA